MHEDQIGRSTLVKVVTSPLGFFALSLLIVEGFLGITLVFSGLAETDKFIGMVIGAALFFLVVLGVWVLVLWRPTNLTFGESSHLEHERMDRDYGTAERSLTRIEVNKEMSSLNT